MSGHVKTSQGPQKHLRPQRVNEMLVPPWEGLDTAARSFTGCDVKEEWEGYKD